MALAHLAASASFLSICKRFYCHRCCYFLLGSAIIVVVVLLSIFQVLKVLQLKANDTKRGTDMERARWVLLMRVRVARAVHWGCERPCLFKGRSGAVRCLVASGAVRCLVALANGWAAVGSTWTFLRGPAQEEECYGRRENESYKAS
jgi:hypothetical protein